MQRHFKQLHFKIFPMVSWRPKLVFFSLSTKALYIWDFPTNATPQVGVHFGSHWAHSLLLSPTCESVLLPNLFFWPHQFLHSTLSYEATVKVITNKVFKTNFLLKWNMTFVPSYFCLSRLLKCFHHSEITIIINCYEINPNL